MFARWLARHRFRRMPRLVAGPEQVDAQLDLFFHELLELTRTGQDLADLDEAVADACARAQEWTA